MMNILDGLFLYFTGRSMEKKLAGKKEPVVHESSEEKSVDVVFNYNEYKQRACDLAISMAASTGDDEDLKIVLDSLSMFFISLLYRLINASDLDKNVKPGVLKQMTAKCSLKAELFWDDVYEQIREQDIAGELIMDMPVKMFTAIDIVSNKSERKTGLDDFTDLSKDFLMGVGAELAKEYPSGNFHYYAPKTLANILDEFLKSLNYQ